jgi:hypothetical protein
MRDPVVVVSYVSGTWSARVEGIAERRAFGERHPALAWAHRWAHGAFKGIRRMGPDPADSVAAG